MRRVFKQGGESVVGETQREAICRQLLKSNVEKFIRLLGVLEAQYKAQKNLEAKEVPNWVEKVESEKGVVAVSGVEVIDEGSGRALLLLEDIISMAEVQSDLGREAVV